MILRPSNARAMLTLSVVTFAVLFAACDAQPERTPNANAPAANAQATGTPSATPAANANQTGGASARAKLNLNTASPDDFLKAIPGLGNRMVHEFEEYRPYRSIQQFRREMSKYVKAEQIAEYEKYVYVPISRNESDAATLQQIPGLDTAEAQALIAARPYASDEAFLSKLASNVSEAELAAARTYLGGK